MEQTNKFDIFSRRRQLVAEINKRKQRMLRVSSSTISEEDDKTDQLRKDKSDNSVIENSDDEIVELSIKKYGSVQRIGRTVSPFPDIDKSSLCVTTTSTKDSFATTVKNTNPPHAIAAYEDSWTPLICSAYNEDILAETITLTNTSRAVTASNYNIEPCNVDAQPASEKSINKSHTDMTHTFHDTSSPPCLLPAYDEHISTGSEVITFTNKLHSVVTSHDDIEPYNVEDIPSSSEKRTNESHGNITRTTHDNSSSQNLLSACTENDVPGLQIITLINNTHALAATHNDNELYNVGVSPVSEYCFNKSHANTARASHDNSSSSRGVSGHNEEDFAGSEIIIPTNSSHNIVVHDESSSPRILSAFNNVLHVPGTSYIPDCNSNETYLSDISLEPKKKKRMCSSSKKSYIDFLSDDEQDFSAGSSDLWTNDESDGSGEKQTKKRRKRLQKTSKSKDNTETDMLLIRKKNKDCNQRKIRQNLKQQGKCYENRNGETITEKTLQENPCAEAKCIKKCYEISEEKRYSLFTHFYNLDSQRRRDWLLRCCKILSVKRKRTSATESRRNSTYEYFINEGEDHRPVCQKFLMATLDITQKYIRYTMQNAREGMAQIDMRKPNAQPKYTEEVKAYVHSYINKLPIMPSHYSRKRSNKVYLPQEFKNMTHIFRKYLDDCIKNNQEAVSDTVFRQILKEYNISIHVPKKDKCILCTKVENNIVESDETLQQHLEEKKASFKRFKIHQNLRSSTNDTITTSFDLQKVLNTPYGESMLLFYSRKYSVYNLTFYESTTQDVFCYTWGESEGKRGSNEISTCLLKYLEVVDGRGIKNLLLYCDSCGGQNKNKTVLATINYFLKRSAHLEVVQINYLLPGHTYMPVDSVHAVIEREVKRLTVWGPSQWATFFQSARKRPRPYYVNTLDHADFLDFGALATLTFTPSTLKNMKLKDVKTVTFKKKHTDHIYIKLSMKENANEIEVKLFEKLQRKGKGKGRGKGKRRAVESIDNSVQDVTEEVNCTIKPLYSTRLPISAPKYNDLKRLCEKGIIPKAYHAEYLNLPSSVNTHDILPETDAEDGEHTDDESI